MSSVRQACVDVFTWAAIAIVLLGPVAVRGEESPALQRGHNLYSEHCMMCHGVAGRGNGALAADLRVPPADLTLISARRSGVFPDVEIREIIDGRRKVRAHGPVDMPIWGHALDRRGPAGSQGEEGVRDTISSLVEYLKSIQRALPAE